MYIPCGLTCLILELLLLTPLVALYNLQTYLSMVLTLLDRDVNCCVLGIGLSTNDSSLLAGSLFLLRLLNAAVGEVLLTL